MAKGRARPAAPRHRRTRQRQIAGQHHDGVGAARGGVAAAKAERRIQPGTGILQTVQPLAANQRQQKCIGGDDDDAVGLEAPRVAFSTRPNKRRLSAARCSAPSTAGEPRLAERRAISPE